MADTAPSRKLKIALLVDDVRVSNYVYQLAEWASTHPDIALSHLIIQQLPNRAPPQRLLSRLLGVWCLHGLGELLSRILWGIIIRAEKIKLGRSVYRDHFDRYDVSAIVPQTIQIFPAISKSGLVHRFIADDIAAIKAQEFDVLIRCGTGILRGDILHAARLGTLSFHHGDNRVNRGVPAGFWEVLHQEPTTGFIIQQLTDELDGGHVVCRGAFPTQRYWLANQAALYTRSNGYMKQLLAKIAETKELPETEESLPYFNPLFRQPGLRALLCYIAQFVVYKIKHILLHNILGLQQRWGVAYAYAHWKHLVMWRSVRIENPKGRFLADPFVISRDGKDYCFVEDYDYASQRGSIAVYACGKQGATCLGQALSEPFHLSFPYLFEYKHTLYMVPESARNKDIRIYECVSFPTEWKLKRVVMTGVSAADTMIFKQGDYWWLFTNMNPQSNAEHCSELSAFYTDDPIEGEWMPHAANPLIIDPARARNGGILFDESSVYRVVQRFGYMQYGAGSAIYKITQLDPERYAETLLCEIKPNFFKRLIGTHHMHSNGTITAFDFVEKTRLD